MPKSVCASRLATLLRSGQSPQATHLYVDFEVKLLRSIFTLSAAVNTSKCYIFFVQPNFSFDFKIHMIS